MEYSSINTLTKLGTNDYELWTLTLSREKLYELRQKPFVSEGNIRQIFERVPSTEHQSKDVCNFVLPHGEELKLLTVDMGTDFREKHRHNGSSVRGTREEIIAELRQTFKKQGYDFRSNASFMNVDVLETLQKVVDHNTNYYQTDFEYDKEMLREAAGEKYGNRHFLWLSRDSGTWCVPERSVYISQTSPFNSWLYYGGGQNDHIKSFWIELQGMDDDKVMGNILEIDYQQHLDYVCAHSFAPTSVEVVFKNPNDCRVFDYRDYDQNWESITQRYGSIDRKRYLVEEPDLLARAVIQGHGLLWGTVEPITIDDYVKRLDHDRLYDYGYTANDMVLTGPMDAEKAVKHGLNCFVLNDDGSKESITGREEFQKAIYASKLFGMTSGEKELLQYFKQDATPLFSNDEMRKIYALVLQAAMKNESGENSLLDNVIHKVECTLPRESDVLQEPKALETAADERVQ